MHAYMHAVICLRYMQTCLHACVQKFKRRCRIHTGSDRKTDRQTHRLAGRQTDRHRYIHTDIHTYRQTYIHIHLYIQTSRHTNVSENLSTSIRTGRQRPVHIYVHACLHAWFYIDTLVLQPTARSTSSCYCEFRKDLRLAIKLGDSFR